jgi:hypothetical protein
VEHVRPDQDQADAQRGSATAGKVGAGGTGPETGAVPGKTDAGGASGAGGTIVPKGGKPGANKPDANKPQQTAGAWEADDGLMSAFGVGDDPDGGAAAGGGGHRAERKGAPGGGATSPDHAAESAAAPEDAHADEHAAHERATEHAAGAPGGGSLAGGAGGGGLAGGALAGGALAGGALAGGGLGGGGLAGGALAGGASTASATPGGGLSGGASTSASAGAVTTGASTVDSLAGGGQTATTTGATTASTEPKVTPNSAGNAEARPEGDPGGGGGGDSGGDSGGGSDSSDSGGESTSDEPGDVQAKSTGLVGSSAGVHRAAAEGISGGGGPLPYADKIQASFGHHDVGGVVAHTGSAAQAANQAIGAEAYATGNHVAFGTAPSLHTAAHEAAHVVQQRAGVHLKGGVGEAGDPYERHADAVADRVVAGQSATDLLDQVSGGGGGDAVVQRRPGAGGAAAISLDELRHAIDDNNAANALVGFRALSAADRRALAADRNLTIRLVRLLEPADGLTVLRDLRLTRSVALAVAAGARPADADFLARVLQQLRLTTPAALAGAWNDLRANPAFVVPAVLMPVINASSVTAQQQAAFAATANGEAMTRALASGVSPLQSLLRLAGNLTVVRTTFVSRPSFARWLLETEPVLESLVAGSPDGAAWARAMWGTPHEAILVQWIGRNPAYWGQILGEALLRPAGGDATRLRASAPLANAVFAAIGSVQGGNGVAAVLGALRFTLAEKIKAMSGASLLSAETLGLLLNAPGTTAAQQSTMTQDADAIRLIQTVSGGRLPHEVLTILATDSTAFCAAVARRNAFTAWVTGTPSLLVQVIVAVPNYNKWVDCFRTLDNPTLLLTAAADPAVQTNFRTAIVARGAWHWLVTRAPHPLTDELQATALLAMFGDGQGIALADKYQTWAALYTTPLKRTGENLVLTGTAGAVPWERTYYAVNPNDDAMNLFFHQYRQLPRTHVNTAAAIMMCEKYRLKATVAGAVVFINDQVTPRVPIPAPGKLPLDTSYYMNNNWIVMRSINGRGAPDARRIASQYGAPEAVNTPGVDPVSGGTAQNMTLFANHATHEVGHAVGNRTLTRDGFNTTGDNWAKSFGNWNDSNGTAEGYARICGFTPALEGANYTLTDVTDPTRTLVQTGLQIRTFLTGIAAGGPSSQAGHAIPTAFGGLQGAMLALQAEATIGPTILFDTINTLWASLPGEGYHFPRGIAAGATLHFFCTRWGNKWVTYDADCFRNKVSNYSVSSYKEMFAELYTAKFTGGRLPAANSRQNPAAFFDALAHADPAELGLTAPAASPGATPGGASTSTTPGAAGASGATPGGAAPDATRAPGDRAGAPAPASTEEVFAAIPGHDGRPLG